MATLLICESPVPLSSKFPYTPSRPQCAQSLVTSSGRSYEVAAAATDPVIDALSGSTTVTIARVDALESLAITWSVPIAEGGAVYSPLASSIVPPAPPLAPAHLITGWVDR